LRDLLQHGLLRASFVPPRPTRELRDLTRYRVSLTQEINRIANRVQKVLEDANIKLASVATDALGASGRAMLEAMLAGERDSMRLVISWRMHSASFCPTARRSALRANDENDE